MDIGGFEKYLIRYVLPGLAFILLGGLVPALRFRPDDISDISLSQISLIVLAGLALGFILDALQSSKLIPGRNSAAKRSSAQLKDDFGVSDKDSVRVLWDVARIHFKEHEDAIWVERTDRAYMAMNLGLASFLFSFVWLGSIALRLFVDDGPAWIEDNLRFSSSLLFDDVGLFIALDLLLFTAYTVVAVVAATSGAKDLRTSYGLFRVLALGHKDVIKNEVARLNSRTETQ